MHKSNYIAESENDRGLEFKTTDKFHAIPCDLKHAEKTLRGNIVNNKTYAKFGPNHYKVRIEPDGRILLASAREKKPNFKAHSGIFNFVIIAYEDDTLALRIGSLNHIFLANKGKLAPQIVAAGSITLNKGTPTTMDEQSGSFHFTLDDTSLSEKRKSIFLALQTVGLPTAILEWFSPKVATSSPRSR